MTSPIIYIIQEQTAPTTNASSDIEILYLIVGWHLPADPRAAVGVKGEKTSETTTEIMPASKARGRLTGVPRNAKCYRSVQKFDFVLQFTNR